MLLAVSAVGSMGQEILSTKSGQKILLNTDGSWTMTARDAILDENGNITMAKTTGADVFEVPQMVSNLTKSQEREVDLLIKELEEKEATYRVVMHYDELSEVAESDLPEGDSQQKQDRKETVKKYNQTSKYIADLKQLNQLEQSKISKRLADIKNEIDSEIGVQAQLEGAVASQTRVIRQYDYPTSFDMAPTVTDKTRYPCEIAYDDKDPVTNKKKKETADLHLFSYTQPKLKPYFKSDDFMHCSSLMTKVGKNYYLTLKLRLRSKEASKNYGQLENGGEIRIEFIDGTFIIGTNMVANSGEIEPYSGNTLYEGIYSISKASVKDLEKKLVDNIGIMWSSGFEQYDIYQVDLLQHQVKCLTK